MTVLFEPKIIRRLQMINAICNDPQEMQGSQVEAE